MAKKNKEATQVVEVQAVEAKTLPSLESLSEQGLKTKSSIIRYLDSEGFKRSEIANHLNIRYQHVRNVLTQPLKKAA